MLRNSGARLTGVDFSSSLVNMARQHLPTIAIQTAQAASLPFPSNEFDAVLANGVFLYFPDSAYAHAALTEILRVCQTPGRVYITDIPDISKEQSCRAERRAANASEVPSHLYYPKKFFQDFAAEQSLTAQIADQNIPGYANNRFRFNALFEKS
jgi:ubiquinone/menaquinone biosynthesis C-methylase UbiE